MKLKCRLNVRRRVRHTTETYYCKCTRMKATVELDLKYSFDATYDTVYAAKHCHCYGTVFSPFTMSDGHYMKTHLSFCLLPVALPPHQHQVLTCAHIVQHWRMVATESLR